MANGRYGREPEEWTTEAFLDHFLRLHDHMPERRFAFVLGAGASATSGIKTGGRLVDDWLEELKLRAPDGKDQSVENWANGSLGIDDFRFERRAEFYPQIYERRFGDDLEEGNAYLEDVMKDAEPSLGYSMLAQILTETRHQVVITTNFDNLVADSVLYFTDTFAQSVGHESLTGFIRVEPRRPLVAKIHRDLLLGPQSDPDQTTLLHEDWARALRKLFTRYTPLFVGYGGNDGSLMNFLRLLTPGQIPGGIFWCYRQGDEKPGSRILNLVARHKGKLVSIADFDVFMTHLADALGFGLIDTAFEKRAAKRAKGLRDGWEKVKHRVGEKGTAQAKATFEKVEKRRASRKDVWWAWWLEAHAQKDPNKQEAIYRKGLEQFPNSPELTANFAVFMHRDGKDYDEAEELYRKVLELDPNLAANVGNLALFMREIRKDNDEAEKLYRKALKLDPNHANNVGNFALFMHQVRKDNDEAEKLYRKALELDPNLAHIVGGFAVFMYEVRKNYDEAEKHFRKALELDPDDLQVRANYLEFLLVSRRLEEARRVSAELWGRTSADVSSLTTIVAFQLGLLLLFDGKDDIGALARLKTLFAMHLHRETWRFEGLLSAAESLLEPDNKKLYTALAEAIRGPDKVAALDDFPRWKAVTPIPLDEPWPLLAA